MYLSFIHYVCGLEAQNAIKESGNTVWYPKVFFCEIESDVTIVVILQ